MAKYNRVSDYERSSSSQDSPQGMMQEACNQTAEMIGNNPASAALITFGVGFGVGLLLTSMMRPSRPTPQSWAQSHMPRWANRDTIADMVSRVLPDALAKHMS
jgi:hypothetical protein